MCPQCCALRETGQLCHLPKSSSENCCAESIFWLHFAMQLSGRFPLSVVYRAILLHCLLPAIPTACSWQASASAALPGRWDLEAPLQGEAEPLALQGGSLRQHIRQRATRHSPLLSSALPSSASPGHGRCSLRSLIPTNSGETVIRGAALGQGLGFPVGLELWPCPFPLPRVASCSPPSLPTRLFLGATAGPVQAEPDQGLPPVPQPSERPLERNPSPVGPKHTVPPGYGDCGYCATPWRPGSEGCQSSACPEFVPAQTVTAFQTQDTPNLRDKVIEVRAPSRLPRQLALESAPSSLLPWPDFQGGRDSWEQGLVIKAEKQQKMGWGVMFQARSWVCAGW